MSNLNNPFDQKRIPYTLIILNQDWQDQTKYFITTPYEKTNNFVHSIDLLKYIEERLQEGTIVTIKPTDLNIIY